MFRASLLALLAVATDMASAAVEWQAVGSVRGKWEHRFCKTLEEQTGTNAVKQAGESTYVFHLGEDDFIRGLGLDLKSLHPYGYYIAIRGRQVALVGRNGTGTGYACFDFLKRYTGYRSFGGKLGEIVPRIGSLDLPAELTVREEPDVASFNLAGESGLNGAFARVGRITCQATHAMSNMVKPEMYEAHPEYFPLVNGQRVKPEKGPWNPCMSNPDLPELFRAYARRYFEKNPDRLGIPMGVNDGGGDCDCDGCRAKYAKHGNQYVEFYNAAAKILAQEQPGKWLAFIAYSARCSKAPTDGLRMAPNILVEVTGYANTYAAWKKAGVKNFGVYEYLYALNGSRMAPACYSHHVADYFRNIRKEYGFNTMWEEYFCGSPLIDGGRQYVVNELLWDMDADVDALLDDYHLKMYGAAAPAMRKFSDICEEAFADNPARKRYQDEYHNPIQFNGYTVKRIRRIDAALAEASALAPSGSAAARRVELVTRLWGAMRLLMDNWQVAKRLSETEDHDKILRLAERGLKDISDFEKYEMSDADSAEAFLNPEKFGFRQWKAQSNSQFAPLPPLERAIDAAFERIGKDLGKEKSRTFFSALTNSPTLGVFAATRLYLMDNAPTNLIANGSFEDVRPPKAGAARSFSQRKTWSFWRFPSARAEAWTDETEAHSGERSAVIGENQMSCGIIGGKGVQPNCRYRFSFWVKRNDDNSGRSLGSVGIRMKDGKGAWIDSGSAISCPVPLEAVGKWTKCSIIFTTPNREGGLSIIPILGAPSQGAHSRIWYDDVRLEKLCEVGVGK